MNRRAHFRGRFSRHSPLGSCDSKAPQAGVRALIPTLLGDTWILDDLRRYVPDKNMGTSPVG
jgi:hypothetical protein